MQVLFGRNGIISSFSVENTIVVLRFYPRMIDAFLPYASST
jgi:hypothetical protein